MQFVFGSSAIFVVLIALSSAVCLKTNSVHVLKLDSRDDDGQWTFENADGSINGDAIVPGGIYTDLMRNGVIEDIFFEDNDVKTRWVSKETWTYKRNFQVTKDMLDKKAIDLVFNGLDVIAKINVNGENVGNSDNMYVRYMFSVKDHVKEGENLLEVEFQSPVLKAAEYSQEDTIPPDCVPYMYSGECHANQLRKMQASFSWDWGPAFPSVGIWKSVELLAYSGAIITDVTTRIMRDPADTMWELNIKVYLLASERSMNVNGHIMSTIEVNNNSSISIHDLIDVDVQDERNVMVDLKAEFTDSQISRWWPNGYGEQKLYTLTTSFSNIDIVNETFYKEIDIGFRTIELIQSPITSNPDEGLTFYFKVNDISMFMKGTNWIPAHVLPELGYDEERVDTLLQAAKDVNMNMMRVWGGGVYESDYFYKRCDELGILIWQDLMFACSMYPVNDRFLSSVYTEIDQVILRLQHHASIAIWAGNNENEIALRGNWYGTSSNFEKYKAEYIKLYVDSIRPIITQNDPGRKYLVSSPSNGIKSEEDGYIAENPGDSAFGDTHYYNYVQDLWSMDTYPKSRFSSEYGFQSVPSIDTLNTATNDSKNLDLKSQFMTHRQHSEYNGYESILSQIEKHLTLPEEGHPKYLSEFVYNSQITQAMAIKTETEFYRQSRFDWMTMGALYWQLNDVWQAPTWSGIEFTGRWKMLHYFARDFFSPILISPRLLLTNEISIFLINDKIENIYEVTVVVDIFNWDSLEPISTTKTPFIGITGSSIEKMPSNIILPSDQNERKKIYYRFSLLNKDSEHLSPYNYIFPEPLKDIIGYKEPNITVSIEPDSKSDTEHIIKITTDSVGLFVWLEVPYIIGKFSENGFILSETSKTFMFYSVHPINNEEFSKIVTVNTVKMY